MTRDQMHNTLRYVREQLADERGEDYSGVMALDMVLEELEQEPSGRTMTREEAIEVLQQDIPCEQDTDFIEALEMAIKALKQKPCPYSTKDGYCQHNDIAETIPTEQEPSGDLISRQDAIDAIWDGINMDIYTREVKETLEELPSVKQEPKTGHWITVEMTQGDGCRYTVTYCSECDEDVDYRTDYCPNCGCRMVEPQESEDKE